MEDIMATEVHLTQAVSPLSVTPMGSDKVKIQGFAVHCGTFNQVTITKEELEKGAYSIVGAPIIKAHDMYGKPEEVVIGKVMSQECKLDPSVNKYGLYYEAEMDAQEEELIRKMNLGFISSTSIGFQSEHICSLCGQSIWKCDHWFGDEGFQILAKDINIHELSIVAVPADREASVEISFSKKDLQAFEQLTKEKELRRTKMSDFEKKYNDLTDEFAKFKMDSADEVTKLKEEFSKEKEELELSVADKVEEALNLQGQVDSLSKENASLKEENEKFKEAFKQMEEDKLTELRKEVIALNKEVYGGLEEESINNFSEASLKQFIDVFSNQKKHMVTLSPENNITDKYEEDVKIDEDAAPLDQLAARLGIKN